MGAARDDDILASWKTGQSYASPFGRVWVAAMGGMEPNATPTVHPFVAALAQAKADPIDTTPGTIEVGHARVHAKYLEPLMRAAQPDARILAQFVRGQVIGSEIPTLLPRTYSVLSSMMVLTRKYLPRHVVAAMDGKPTAYRAQGNGLRVASIGHAFPDPGMPTCGTVRVPTKGLVGATLTVHDMELLKDRHRWCESGWVEFGEKYLDCPEFEGGTYECESCGREHDDDDGERRLTSFDDTDLTQEMLDYIERHAPGDPLAALAEVLDTSEGTDASEVWAIDTAEIARAVEDKASARHHGHACTYPEIADYVEETLGLDGDDDDYTQNLADGVVYAIRLADVYTTAGLLPPIPCYVAGMRWDPTECTLSVSVSGSLRVIHHAGDHGGMVYLDGTVLLAWTPSSGLSLAADASEREMLAALGACRTGEVTFR